MCSIDFKHPDRNKFEEVRTKDAQIQKNTLAICKNKDDKQAKPIEGRLIVASKWFGCSGSENHASCRINFKKPVPQKKTPDRPVCTE